MGSGRTGPAGEPPGASLATLSSYMGSSEFGEAGRWPCKGLAFKSHSTLMLSVIRPPRFEVHKLPFVGREQKCTVTQNQHKLAIWVMS